jgi:hypothetical protein
VQFSFKFLSLYQMSLPKMAGEWGKQVRAASSKPARRSRHLRGVAQMKRLNVSKTPEQSQRDDRSYGDHTEISELLSNGLMLLHFSTS